MDILKELGIGHIKMREPEQHLHQLQSARKMQSLNSKV
jgi:hypothetical protein